MTQFKFRALRQPNKHGEPSLRMILFVAPRPDTTYQNAGSVRIKDQEFEDLASLLDGRDNVLVEDWRNRD